MVVEELYECDAWPYGDVWPELGDAECGRVVGCLCGTENEEVQPSSDVETSET